MTTVNHSNRLLLIALALSLVFNVFVLVGFVQSRAGGPPHGPGAPSGPSTPPMNVESPEQVVQRVARDLNLNDEQRAAFAELHAMQRSQGAVFGGSVAMVRQEIADELANDDPDPEKLRDLIVQEADLIRDRRLAAAALMARFADVLTPEQRRVFGQRAGLLPHAQRDDRGPSRGEGRNPGDPRREGAGGRRQGERRFNPGPEIMRRFDANNNGTLEPEEAQAARRELEARRREFFADDRPGGPGRPSDRRGDGAPADRHASERPPAGARDVIDAFGPAIMYPLWRWFDQDSDGQLSDAEKQSLREFTQSRQAPQRPAGTQRERGEIAPPQSH